MSDIWAKGGAGGEELARVVAEVAEQSEQPSPLYDWNWSVEDKIKAVATKIYGAKAIDYTSKARADLRKIKQLELEKLPVCIAKTQKSLSDNPKLLGHLKILSSLSARSRSLPVRVSHSDHRRYNAHAWLPAQPAAENIDIDDDGNISGLF